MGELHQVLSLYFAQFEVLPDLSDYSFGTFCPRESTGGASKAESLGMSSR